MRDMNCSLLGALQKYRLAGIAFAPDNKIFSLGKFEFCWYIILQVCE